MSKQILFALLLMVMATAIHLESEHRPVHEGEKKNVYLKVNGQRYLTGCSFCPEKNFGTARNWNIKQLKVFVGETSPTEASKFEMESFPDGSVKFKRLDTGTYLAWCQNECKMSSPITIISTRADIPNTLWKLETRSDGKRALKASNGKYLGLCNGCITGGFLAYKGVDLIGLANKDDINDPWAGIEIINI